MTVMWAFMPSILDLKSSSKPVITESTIIKAVTPTVIPATEINVMTEIKDVLLLAFMYLSPMNHSYPTALRDSPLFQRWVRGDFGLLFPEERKEYHVPYGRRIRQEHDEPVYAYALSGGSRHAVL